MNKIKSGARMARAVGVAVMVVAIVGLIGYMVHIAHTPAGLHIRTDLPTWEYWAIGGLLLLVVFVGGCIVIAIRESVTNRGPSDKPVQKK